MYIVYQRLLFPYINGKSTYTGGTGEAIDAKRNWWKGGVTRIRNCYEAGILNFDRGIDFPYEEVAIGAVER